MPLSESVPGPRATTVEVLLTGYCESDEGGRSERACSTVALVRDGDLNVLTDPGSPPDPGVLVKALAERGLSPDDIDVVFVSHAHPDHSRLAGFFPRAAILDFWGRWEGDRLTKGIRVVSEKITVIETPGHSDDSVTLMVETVDGIVAVCGDVFWGSEGPREDVYAVRPDLLERSRSRLLELADYIVPGHGDMYETGRKR